MIVFIYGLDGSGKSTLSNELKRLHSNAHILDADEVRKDYDDWDFSDEGRKRQHDRMVSLATTLSSYDKNSLILVNYICPKREWRKDWFEIPNAMIVFMNKKHESEYEDTQKIWEAPENGEWDEMVLYGDSIEETARWLYDYRIWDSRKPTGLMLGRFQPFHDGHYELFKKIISKHQQVTIGVRNTYGLNDDRYKFIEIKNQIENKIDRRYRFRYNVVLYPNITDICYGRDVGYTMSKIDLPDEIEAIRGRDIRNENRTDN